MEEEVVEATNVAVQAVAEVAEGIAEQTKSMFHFNEIKSILSAQNIVKMVSSLVAIILLIVVYKLIKHFVNKGIKNKFQKHTVQIINKGMNYLFWTLLIMFILSLFGIKLSAIWGAAGVAGLALGFAAQTSVSNLISGLFVLGEKALRVGDFIEVSGVSGTVSSIGLLSIKIDTPDNQSIRIPNSSIINTNLQNYSSNNNRRILFDISVAYETDLEKALKVMQQVPSMCPSALTDPAPVCFYDGLGESGITLKLGIWFKKQDLIAIKNEVYVAIVKLCKKNKIEIPYNKLDLNVKSGSSIKVSSK